MESFFFYAFSALAVVGALALVAFRNPVSSALAMVASFIGFAALFVGLNAYFVGIIQILVYAGAIMVLFLFIIMLLDLKVEERKTFRLAPLLAGVVIPVLFLIQLLGVLPNVPQESNAALPLEAAASHYHNPAIAKDTDQSEIYQSLKDGSLPDVHLVGLTIFGSDDAKLPGMTRGYNFPLQITGVLLLVATVGVVALSLKRKPGTAPASPPETAGPSPGEPVAKAGSVSPAVTVSADP